MKLGEWGLYVNRGGQIKNPHIPPLFSWGAGMWRVVDIMLIMRHQQR